MFFHTSQLLGGQGDCTPHDQLHGWSLGPIGLKNTWSIVYPCPKSPEEDVGEGIVMWPSALGGRGRRGSFLTLCASFSSLSLSFSTLFLLP